MAPFSDGKQEERLACKENSVQCSLFGLGSLQQTSCPPCLTPSRPVLACLLRAVFPKQL